MSRRLTWTSDRLFAGDGEARRPWWWRISRRVARSDDPEQLRQAQVLLLFTLLLAVQCLIWGIAHLSGGSAALGLIFLVALVTLAGAFAALWWAAPRLAFIGHLVLAVANAEVIIATAFTGGLRLTNVTPFLSLVLAAIFVLGRAGWIWAAVPLVGAGAFEAAVWLGIALPDAVAPEDRQLDALLTWVFAAGLILLYAAIYEEARAAAVGRARQASRAKDRFLATLSHEIRTPLHVAQAALAELAPALRAPEQARQLGLARDAMASLSLLLTDLLELTRARGAPLTLQAHDFDPGALAGAVGAMLTRLCGEKGLAFALELDPALPARLSGDEGRLRQVLLNVGVNAVKFTDRGSVRVAVAPQPGAPATIVWTVTDTGRGIAAADQERIFECFSQGEGGRDLPNRGVGLGLFIAREIVQAMGGTIRVASAPGAGSTFTLVTHCAKATGEAPTPRLERERRAPVRRRVLVVEDNAMNLAVAEQMLRHLECEVIVARDGTAAVAAWERQRPEIVLMDLQLPPAGGLAAAAEIRARERATGAQRTTIIAVTGNATDATVVETRRQGLDDCLFKPFGLDELRDTMLRHLVPPPPSAP